MNKDWDDQLFLAIDAERQKKKELQFFDSYNKFAHLVDIAIDTSREMEKRFGVLWKN